MPVSPITIEEYTTEVLDGTGAFDAMMRSTKAHVAQEFNQNRIKGSDYATVYLGALNAVGDRALEFLLRKDEIYLKNQILEVELAKAENERDLIAAQILKINAEIDLVNAQTALASQQLANAVLEGNVLIAQECKLKAEFDVLVEQVEKVKAETALLVQKKITEQAQTSGTGVAADSLLGKQITLYARQADGFLRDAEQKAAKILADTWNVRRTTDELTVAGSVPGGFDNKLGDDKIGAAIGKMLEGIGA